MKTKQPSLFDPPTLNLFDFMFSTENRPNERLSKIEKVERLLADVGNYRQPTVFEELMKFCSKMRSLSPYNAWLVNQQLPSAKAVLSAESWMRNYGRKIRDNARPLIILRPFGPIDFVWDISDTLPTNKSSLLDDELIERINHPYKTTGELDSKTLDNLEHSMSYNGISVNYSLRSGITYGAQIKQTRDYEILLRINERTFKWKSFFLISIQEKANKLERFSSICHELGHLFCHHLSPPNTNERDWKLRNVNYMQEEFEAETVSWLICSKYGLKTNSLDYLKCFTDKQGLLPMVNIGAILKAAGEVYACTLGGYKVERGLLFKYDKEFKRVVKPSTA